MSGAMHEEVRVIRGERSGLPIIVAVHSTKFGPAAGGVRLSNYPDWRDGLEDALRLSEAMTMKCAIAQLPNGGAKTVIALPPGATLEGDARRAAMLDLGDAINGFQGRYAAAEDVGTTAYDLAIAREVTEWAYCLPEEQGGTGEPSEPTAIGVHLSIRATCQHLFGDPSPEGRAFTIVGLGQVGGRVARLLAADGAKVTVTDIDTSKRALAEEIGATWVELDGALTLPTEILVPAALGGVLTAALVPQLDCRAIVGPANNQLATEAVAELLQQRGILWAPDFVVNGGGVIYGALVETAGFTKEEALERVAGIGGTLSSIFELAERDGTTPSQAAVTLALTRLAAG